MNMLEIRMTLNRAISYLEMLSRSIEKMSQMHNVDQNDLRVDIANLIRDLELADKTLKQECAIK